MVNMSLRKTLFLMLWLCLSCQISRAEHIGNLRTTADKSVRAELGEDCYEPSDCTGDGQVCIFYPNGSARCACDSDHVENGSGTACLGKVDLGQECETNWQCDGTGQICGDGGDGLNRCVCDAAWMEDPTGTKCILKRGLGSRCEVNPDCPGVGQVCGHDPDGNYVCVCDPDHVSNQERTECIPKVGLGEECEMSGQCRGEGQTCVAEEGGVKKCVCGSSYIVDPTTGTECLRKVGLGSPCTVSGQCTGEGQECLQGTFIKTCACKWEYIENKESTACLIIRNEINETCQESQQCTFGSLGKMADCLNGRCGCSEGATYLDGKCMNKTGPGLGDICRSHQECILGVNEYAECVASEDFTFRCACIPEATEVDNTCRLRRVGDSCVVNADCTRSIADGVECDDCTKTCECKFGYKASPDGSACAVKVCVAGFSFT